MKHFTKKLALLSLLVGLSASAWADEVKTAVYSNDFETSSDWTAKGKTDGWSCNSGVTTANTFNSNVIGVGSGSGDKGLVSPSMSISDDITLVDVELKFKMDACTSGKSSGIEFITSDVNVNNGYVSSGTPFFSINASASGNGYWGSITVGGEDLTTTLNSTGTYENNSLNRNTTGIVVLNVRFDFSTKVATFSLSKADGTSLVGSTNVSFANTNATTLDRIFLHAGKSYGGVTIDDVNVYSVVSDDVTTTYTASFSETADLNPTISIFSDETKETPVVNGLLEDGVTYYYTASLTGYYDYNGSFTVNGENPSVEFTMTAKPTYTYTVYAVDENETQLMELATVTAYEGETRQLIWSKYINVDGQWYVTSENSFAVNVTEVGSKNVVYTASDIAYFFEMENLTRSGGAYLTETDNSYSNGARLRLSKGSLYYTPALAAGVYTLNIGCQNSNNSSSDVYVYTRSSDGTLSDVLYTHTANKGNSTINVTITVPEGYSIAFNGNEGSNNNNARMDYMTLKKVTTDVAVTTDGALNGKYYATYSNADYALDFSAVEGLTAYYVTSATSSNITIEEVEKVPAGAAVLIAGAEATTYQVPVIPNFESTETNLLQVSNGEKTGDGQTIYVLGKGQSGVGFYLKKKDSAIAAGKAYLEIEDDDPGQGVKSFLSLGGDDAVAISSVEAELGTGILYNLNGQRVAAPVKGGLYIMNGKKVLVK